MANKNTRQTKRKQRHSRVRAKIVGTAKAPRLCVFRSNSHIYAQLIDDNSKKILAQANDIKIKAKGKKKIDLAAEVGTMIAKLAQEKKIDTVIFDRGGFKYHGRIKSLAEGARQGGLKF